MLVLFAAFHLGFGFLECEDASKLDGKIHWENHHRKKCKCENETCSLEEGHVSCGREMEFRSKVGTCFKACGEYNSSLVSRKSKCKAANCLWVYTSKVWFGGECVARDVCEDRTDSDQKIQWQGKLQGECSCGNVVCSTVLGHVSCTPGTTNGERLGKCLRDKCEDVTLSGKSIEWGVDPDGECLCGDQKCTHANKDVKCNPHIRNGQTNGECIRECCQYSSKLEPNDLQCQAANCRWIQNVFFSGGSCVPRDATEDSEWTCGDEVCILFRGFSKCFPPTMVGTVGARRQVQAHESCNDEYFLSQCVANHECRKPDFGDQCTLENDNYHEDCTCQAKFCRFGEVQLKEKEDWIEPGKCTIINRSLAVDGGLGWLCIDLEYYSANSMFPADMFDFTGVWFRLRDSEIDRVLRRNCGEEDSSVVMKKKDVLMAFFNPLFFKD